jgi:chaperonin GroEL (HSP60 family)
MLSKIEIKLVDDEGNYSIAHINYKGFVDTLMNHNVDIVHDALEAMVNNYSTKGRMEIIKGIGRVKEVKRREC